MNDLKKVQKNGLELKNIRRQTPEIRTAAVRQNGEALQYADEQNEDLCMEAVKQNGHALKWVENQSRAVCIEAISNSNGYALSDVKNPDAEIYAAAVKRNPYMLEYVPEKMQTPDMCAEAVKDSKGYAMQHVADQNHEFCLEMVRQFPIALRFIKNPDPEVCFAAAEQDPVMKSFIPDREAYDRYVSERGRQNSAAAVSAEKQMPEKEPAEEKAAGRHGNTISPEDTADGKELPSDGESPELGIYDGTDPDILLENIKTGKKELYEIPEELKTPEICAAAVEKNGLTLDYVPEKLKTPELCMAAVKQHGDALISVPEELKTPELCLSAVKEDRHALQYVPEKLKTPEFYTAAVKQDGYVLEHVPEELRTPEMCMAAVTNEGWALQYVPEKLKTPEICMRAVIHRGSALRSVPEELRSPEICYIAALHNSGKDEEAHIMSFIPDREAYDRYVSERGKQAEKKAAVQEKIPAAEEKENGVKPVSASTERKNGETVKEGETARKTAEKAAASGETPDVSAEEILKTTAEYSWERIGKIFGMTVSGDERKKYGELVEADVADGKLKLNSRRQKDFAAFHRYAEDRLKERFPGIPENDAYGFATDIVYGDDLVSAVSRLKNYGAEKASDTVRQTVSETGPDDGKTRTKKTVRKHEKKLSPDEEVRARFSGLLAAEKAGSVDEIKDPAVLEKIRKELVAWRESRLAIRNTLGGTDEKYRAEAEKHLSHLLSETGKTRPEETDSSALSAAGTELEKWISARKKIDAVAAESPFAGKNIDAVMKRKNGGRKLRYPAAELGADELEKIAGDAALTEEKRKLAEKERESINSILSGKAPEPVSAAETVPVKQKESEAPAEPAVRNGRMTISEFVRAAAGMTDAAEYGKLYSQYASFYRVKEEKKDGKLILRGEDGAARIMEDTAGGAQYGKAEHSLMQYAEKNFADPFGIPTPEEAAEKALAFGPTYFRRTFGAFCGCFDSESVLQHRSEMPAVKAETAAVPPRYDQIMMFSAEKREDYYSLNEFNRGMKVPVFGDSDGKGNDFRCEGYEFGGIIRGKNGEEDSVILRKYTSDPDNGPEYEDCIESRIIEKSKYEDVIDSAERYRDACLHIDPSDPDKDMKKLKADDTYLDGTAVITEYRSDTAANLMHNFRIRILKHAENFEDAVKVYEELVGRLSDDEKKKVTAMEKKWVADAAADKNIQEKAKEFHTDTNKFYGYLYMNFYEVMKDNPITNRDPFSSILGNENFFNKDEIINQKGAELDRHQKVRGYRDADGKMQFERWKIGDKVMITTKYTDMERMEETAITDEWEIASASRSENLAVLISRDGVEKRYIQLDDLIHRLKKQEYERYKEIRKDVKSQLKEKKTEKKAEARKIKSAAVYEEYGMA